MIDQATMVTVRCGASEPEAIGSSNLRPTKEIKRSSSSRWRTGCTQFLYCLLLLEGYEISESCLRIASAFFPFLLVCFDKPPSGKVGFCISCNAGDFHEDVYSFGRARGQSRVLPDFICPLRSPLGDETIGQSPKLDPLSDC
jgi:hypothetical protein